MGEGGNSGFGNVQRTGFERKLGDVDDFGARLEDDKEHSDRIRNTVEVEVIVKCVCKARKARIRSGNLLGRD